MIDYLYNLRFLLLISLFQDNELKITVNTEKISINFLDINFCLNSESYQPYRKPIDEPLYINRSSNHPPTILFRLPQTISKRICCCCCCRPHSTNVLPAESSTRIMWQPTVSPPRWQGKAPLCRDSSRGPG